MSFEKPLKKLKTGVIVITTKSENKINGMTAAWFSRVSWEPVLLMVAIAKEHLTKEMIEKSKVFAINVLATDQIEVGKHFGLKSGRKFDKFKGIKYEQGKTGSPLIDGCAAYFDCNLEYSYEAGDHMMFVGEILDAKDLGKDAIEYRSSDYFG